MFLRFFFLWVLALIACGAATVEVRAQARDLGQYDGRLIAEVEIVFEGAAADPVAEAEFRRLLLIAPNTEYSVVRVRDSLQALIESERIANVRVEAAEIAGRAGADGRAPLRLRFIVRPQVRVGDVLIDLVAPPGADISEDEIRARLNLMEPGARLTETALANNADLIQAYLRDRGFFLATVEFEQQLDSTGTRATVSYRITPGEQAQVNLFNINITGFNDARVRPTLRLQTGAPFSRGTLGEDIGRIRQAIIGEGFLAPTLNQPQVLRDPESNRITINLTGTVGPRVTVRVANFELNEERQRELLPVLREGTIDPAAITEGERRLENYLQEQGYFFADVTPVCDVTPPLQVLAESTALGGSICDVLAPEELSGRTVAITYNIEAGRRFSLSDIRLEGTDALAIEDVRRELRTQTATIFGFIPLLGIPRRGITSEDRLNQDRRTIEARMQDLGYRKARATIRQGVALDSDDLIITFVVEEGPLTRVAGIEIRGNQIYTTAQLSDERCRFATAEESCLVVGGAFSRSQARRDGERLRALYSRNGYFEAAVRFDVVELPREGGEERVRLIYTVTESDKVFISRIVIAGNIRTRREAILEAITLREGEVLRADEITISERNLYSTGAFRQVLIRTEPAGETPSGFRRREVIIDVEEQRPRLMTYGFGYSTDDGPRGIFEIRHDNLFGRLRQGALRMRASRRQQLLRLEYFDPRFRRVNEARFSPLSISAQYQRDANITRFFRTAIDRGNFGIVQRLDEEGNAINEFGERTGEPTINRFTFNVETQRPLDREDRTIIFLRYSYEDVRLYNIESLLIRDILRPDRAVRLSRIGLAFVRDTRDDPLDPKRGDLFRLDYSVALRQLGSNLSFNRLRATYERTHTFRRARGAILFGRFQIGVANVFQTRDRDGDLDVDEDDRDLPISERFFAGGATTLRGFPFEEAGPRRVIVPTGEFRNREGEPVRLNPFTVPLGGNALAIANLEARVPVFRNIQLIPFYDGGNVFRRPSDIFRSEPREGENPNLHARWTHTVGLGVGFGTPLGTIIVDYALLLNPPEFIIPQGAGDPAIYRLPRTRIHFRFGRAF